MKRAIVTLAFGTDGCVTNYEKMQLFSEYCMCAIFGCMVYDDSS